MIKVRFLKSPTGKPFLLAYNVGDLGLVTKETCDALLEAGFAEVVEIKSPPAQKTSKATKPKK